MANKRKKVKRRVRARRHASTPPPERVPNLWAEAAERLTEFVKPFRVRPISEPPAAADDPLVDLRRRFPDHVQFILPPATDEDRAQAGEPLPGTIEIPLDRYPGWRVALVPKEHVQFSERDGQKFMSIGVSTESKSS